MSAADFFDSNVLVYVVDERDARKSGEARRLVRQALEQRSAVVSWQVVQETLQVITHKIEVPVTAHDASRFLESTLVPLWRVMPSDDLYQRALDIQARYGYGFYDALIIAAALAGGCTRLYSEDLQHGQRIERLVIVNPFLEPANGSRA